MKWNENDRGGFLVLALGKTRYHYVPLAQDNTLAIE
jgi:hypothetical protein